jgi:hypothetical protein
LCLEKLGLKKVIIVCVGKMQIEMRNNFTILRNTKQQWYVQYSTVQHSDIKLQIANTLSE